MRDILNSLPKIFPGSDSFGIAAEAIVFAGWREAVGAELRQHAVPVRIIKKKLIVAVSSETWRRQVMDLADQMIFKLNSALGTSVVAFIEFRVDAKFVRESRMSVRSLQIAEAEWKTVVQKEVSPGIKKAADAITDESLRKTFLAAAGSSLARQRMNDDT